MGSAEHESEEEDEEGENVNLIHVKNKINVLE